MKVVRVGRHQRIRLHAFQAFKFSFDLCSDMSHATGICWADAVAARPWPLRVRGLHVVSLCRLLWRDVPAGLASLAVADNLKRSTASALRTDFFHVRLNMTA